MKYFSAVYAQKKIHPDKVTHEEEEAVKDPAVRKAIKEIAAEVEKTEGRGQLKVSVRCISQQQLHRSLVYCVKKIL